MVDENGREVSMAVDVNYPNGKCTKKRVFLIDTTKLPKRKHEEYMKNIIKKYRGKI